MVADDTPFMIGGVRGQVEPRSQLLFDPENLQDTLRWFGPRSILMQDLEDIAGRIAWDMVLAHRGPDGAWPLRVQLGARWCIS